MRETSSLRRSENRRSLQLRETSSSCRRTGTLFYSLCLSPAVENTETGSFPRFSEAVGDSSRRHPSFVPLARNIPIIAARMLKLHPKKLRCIESSRSSYANKAQSLTYSLSEIRKPLLRVHRPASPPKCILRFPSRICYEVLCCDVGICRCHCGEKLRLCPS